MDLPMAIWSGADEELVAAATAEIGRLYRQDRHEVGAALRTRSGRIYASVNLDARLRRAGVCAEVIAIGMAVSAGDTEIEAVVAVNREGRVVAPCGICREILADYAPRARIIVPGPAGPQPLPITELLPRRYNKNGEP
jgi:cytidine deaminase